MSALRRIRAMAGWALLRTARSSGDLFWILVLPVLVSFLVANMLGGSGQGKSMPELMVVNEDQTAYASAMIEALSTGFDVQVVERTAAEAELARGNALLALVLPAAFGESVEAGRPQIELLHGRSAVKREAEARIRLAAQSLMTGDSPVFSDLIHETPRGNGVNGEFEQVRGVFGVILVFCLTALLIRGAVIHSEREKGSLQRIISCGVSYWEVVVAHVMSILLIGLLQAAILLTVTGVLGIPWLIEGLWPLIWTVLGSVFCSAGIAVGLAGFVRKPSALQMLAGGLPSLLAMLGGAFFPLDVAPAAVQQLARMNPFYWSMEALSGGMVYRGLASQAVPLALLFLVGVCGIVIGIQGLRRTELT